MTTPTFQDPRLNAFIETRPWSDWADEGDVTVLSVLGSFDRFRIEDLNFELENPGRLPEPGPLREIVEWLESPDNREPLSAYFEKNCRGIKMNPLAKSMWRRLRSVHQLDD